ncbi:MAG TPA: hypothetical protein VGC06_29180, partial [Actinomycetes bacterium]
MVTALVRLGFDDPEAVEGELAALGALRGDGGRLLEELGASANPTLATRALAAIAAAQPDPAGFAGALRR